MGNSDSKASRIQSLEQRQDALMKEHADMAKRLAEAQEASKRQSEAAIEQIAKLMVLLVQSKGTEKTTRADKQQIEIEGVTYTFTEFVNKGGFGQIYKAQARNSGRVVAIKVMRNSPLIQEEIENEIRFLRATKKVALDPHPVIDYYGCTVTSDLIYIAMELAQCDILTFWFGELKGKSAEDRFTFGFIIIIYTLRALAFLEKLNIIHGDIKPQNLVMVQTGDSLAIKLIDFGTVEKMHTLRSLVTVDASKAHTQFFASPEFLRRDSNKMISRRLHKKSDAWAAGVMFYLLFLGKLPWEDEFEYENFVNDPNAQDIVVPGEGGYKLIIELLLKKNPEERASAKDTLLQMKAHPVLGVVVGALEKAICPVDDVCRIRVSDDLREELANFATPRRRAQMADSSSASTSSRSFASSKTRSRRSCRYGRDCFRKNPDHLEEFAHPGDSDYHEMRGTAKAKCRYGAQCYRKNNPEHTAKFAHN